MLSVQPAQSDVETDISSLVSQPLPLYFIAIVCLVSSYENSPEMALLS